MDGKTFVELMLETLRGWRKYYDGMYGYVEEMRDVVEG